MSLEQFVIAMIGAACAVLGWFARELYSAVNRLRDDLQKLEVKLSTDYVRYDRLQDAFKPIMQSLEEIKQALSHKVDK
jgi:hypothetical protein